MTMIIVRINIFLPPFLFVWGLELVGGPLPPACILNIDLLGF